MDEFNSSFYKLDGHSMEEYERSHKPRLDFIVEDLKLDSIKHSAVADVGCGYAPIFRRLKEAKLASSDNFFVGFDGDGSGLAKESCNVYRQVDLNQPFDLDFSFWQNKTELQKFQVVLCFETLEHLTNPYACLNSIKEMLVEDGILYLSIPHDSCTHNTIYPGLLYPVENFKEFLGQMAFEIEDHRIHNKAFSQHIFTLRNKPWGFSKMKWHKSEDKFRNISPQVAVNL